MLVDGLTLTDTSDITNPIVASGTVFPAGSTGELFYRTDTNALYVYTGSSWIPAANGIGFADLNIKPACVVGTTANITLGGFQTIDGYTVVAADRVLVKNQSTGSQNGIYVVSGGSWARADDFDGVPAVLPGDFVFVTRGTAQADTGWVLTTDGVIQIGSTALTFAQFTGASSFNGGTISTALAITSAAPQITLGGANGAGSITSPAGRGIQIAPTTSATGSGSDVVLLGGDTSFGAGVAGSAIIGGGNGASGGKVFIQAGTSTSGTGGYIALSTGPTTTLVERLRVLNTGAWSVGSTGTAYGTTGQVLTSNGNAAPTWQAAAAAAGTLTGTTLAANVVSSSLTSVGTLSTLTVGGNTTATNIAIAAGSSSNGSVVAGGVRIESGASTGVGGGVGLIYILGGNAAGGGGGGGISIIGGNATSSASATGNGGTITIVAGSGNGVTSPPNAGGNINISAGAASTAYNGGYISLSTATSGPVGERLRILNSGAWSVGPNGTDTGASGQVLTSNGAATGPTWQAAGGFTGGTVSGATTFTSAVPQITLGVAGSIAGQVVGAAGAGSVNGSAITMTGGFSATGNGGNASLNAGYTTSGTGGTVLINGGQGATGGAIAIVSGASTGANPGGYIQLSAGTSATGIGGALVISTAPSTTLVERLRILNNGAWSIGSTGTAYGTVGQVLTSNGNAAPTWATVAAPSSFGTDITVHGLTVGSGAGSVATNTAFGTAALAANTTGAFNTAVGHQALTSNVAGGSNTAIGYRAMQVASAVTVTNNTAVGFSALAGLTAGDSNTAVGYGALSTATTASSNSAVGTNALFQNTTGTRNSAIGQSALESNITGTGNAALGYQTLRYTTGDYNLALGFNALYGNTTGSNNIALGYFAGYGDGTHANTTGTFNVFIGYQSAGAGVADTNEIVIGYNAVGLGSNTTVIGNASTTSTKLFGAVTVTGVITTAGLEVGTKIMPQNVQSIAYTTVLADSGAHVLHPSADTTARIFTIPANASVPYPIGTQLTFVNQDSAGVITIGITSDVMRLAGVGTVGDRTLAANGIATALKITATEWIISGTGLS